MKTVRDEFLKKFGKHDTELMEECAKAHSNGVNSINKGDDPFKWTLLICIGYQCFEVESYRKHHGFKNSYDDIKKWIIENGELGTHNGDSDYLTLFAGGYNEYMPKNEVIK